MRTCCCGSSWLELRVRLGSWQLHPPLSCLDFLLLIDIIRGDWKIILLMYYVHASRAIRQGFREGVGKSACAMKIASETGREKSGCNSKAKASFQGDDTRIELQSPY